MSPTHPKPRRPQDCKNVKNESYSPKTQEEAQKNQLPVLLHEARQDRGHRPEDQADRQQVLAIVHVGCKADEDAGESVDKDENRASQNLVLQTLTIVVPHTRKSAI